MIRPAWLAVSLSLLPLVALADDACPSEYASITPPPAELAKLCPNEKAFAEPGKPQNTGNRLFCSYTFPKGYIRVGSNAGMTLADASKVKDPKAAAQELATGLGAEFKPVVVKASWKDAEGYRVDKNLAGTSIPGDVYYVKSSKGVVSLSLHVGYKVPDCVEQVAAYIAKH